MRVNATKSRNATQFQQWLNAIRNSLSKLSKKSEKVWTLQRKLLQKREKAFNFAVVAKITSLNYSFMPVNSFKLLFWTQLMSDARQI